MSKIAFQTCFQPGAFQSRRRFIPTGTGTRDVLMSQATMKIIKSTPGGPLDATLKKTITVGGKASFSARKRERFMNRG